MLTLTRHDCQTTLRSPLYINEKSLYSNKKASIIIKPAPANSGYIFQNQHPSIITTQNNNFNPELHILSALRGMNIDNAYIINNITENAPIYDGSNYDLCTEILTKGISYQYHHKDYFKVKKSIYIQSPDKKSFFELHQSDTPQINIQLNLNSIFGYQTAQFPLYNRYAYYNEISPAREFFHENYHPRRYLKQRLITKGLPKNHRDSPIITYSKESFFKPLRFENEKARHCILDLIGQLSYLGYPIWGEITAYNPHYTFTNYVIQKLKSMII